MQRPAVAALIGTAALAAVGAGALGGGGARAGTPAPARRSTTCAADDAIPTPPGYAGWERSSVVAWEAMEQRGGIVPDIEEDRSHAPPAWWRYPSPLRSADILAAEAKSAKGLYAAVPASDLKAGDVVVRPHGAGVCGKMAIVVGMLNDAWVTVEAEGEGDIKRSGNPTFFDGKALRPEASAYRLNVKKDSSLGHARELDRDLGHLERTIAERPPLVARNGRGAVDEKLHDLVDEAWSLIADPDFQEDRRVLTGRALALAAALDWPGAAEAAAAVLDDAIRRSPQRADALLARAGVGLLAGDRERALGLARGALALPGASSRAHYLLARALLASGKTDEGLAALRRYLDDEPFDPRARKLVATGDGSRRSRRPPPRRPGARRSASRRRPRRSRSPAPNTRSTSSGPSPGASSPSSPRPSSGWSSSSPPAGCCARTARRSAPVSPCWSSAPPPPKPPRWRARAPATCSPTRS